MAGQSRHPDFTIKNYQTMKRYIIPCLVSILAAAGCKSDIGFDVIPPPPVIRASDLMISEIATAINTDPAAGGGRNHYVEIVNGTSASVDLSNYAIGYQASTDLATLAPWSFPSGNYLLLTGTLDTSQCYVIASPQADATAVPRNTIWGTTSTTNANASNPLQLSGNSAIALLKKDAAGSIVLGGVNYSIIDVFGSPLVARVTSTGSSSARNNFVWTVAGETDTRNRTFWRKRAIKDPTTDWEASKGTSPSDSQWELSGDRAWGYSNVGLPSN